MAIRKRRSARSAGRAIAKPQSAGKFLRGGPWNGKRLVLSRCGPGTLRFSLNGWTGQYDESGAWING